MLIVVAMLAAALLSTVDQFTTQRIADNIAAQSLKELRAVLPADSFDNEPHLDVVETFDPELLGSNEILPAYRARRGAQPVAVVLTAVAQNGFSGKIRLLIGISFDGTISGVRVIEHHETPGLGDKIEPGKSGWMLGFIGLHNGDPSNHAWVLKRDGGTFNQITSATVTSRAVLQTVRNAVIYFAAHRQELFAPASNEQPEPRATN